MGDGLIASVWRSEAETPYSLDKLWVNFFDTQKLASGDPDALVGSSLLRNAGNTYQVELVPSNDGGFFVFWNDGGQPFGAEFGASGIQRQPTTLIEDGWGGFNWVTAPIPDSDRLLLLRSGYNSDTHSYETFAEVRLSQGFGKFSGPVKVADGNVRLGDFTRIEASIEGDTVFFGSMDSGASIHSFSLSNISQNVAVSVDDLNDAPEVSVVEESATTTEHTVLSGQVLAATDQDADAVLSYELVNDTVR